MVTYLDMWQSSVSKKALKHMHAYIHTYTYMVTYLDMWLSIVSETALKHMHAYIDTYAYVYGYVSRHVAVNRLEKSLETHTRIHT